jgi:hypothetical protein
VTAQAERLASELASQASTIDELNGLLRGLMKSGVERGAGLAGLEQVFGNIQPQPGLQNRLRLRPQGDDAVVAAPGRLVGAVFLIASRPVEPNLPGRVQVDAPHADFARPHAGGHLELHHRRHLRPPVRQRGLDVGQGDGLDGGRLPSLGSAALEAPHGLQTLQNRRRNQFVFNRPLEQPADASGALVNHPAGQPGGDHPLPGRLERERAEGLRLRVAVEFLEGE